MQDLIGRSLFPSFLTMVCMNLMTSKALQECVKEAEQTNGNDLITPKTLISLTPFYFSSHFDSAKLISKDIEVTNIILPNQICAF